MGTKPDFVSSSSVLIMIDKTFLMDAVKTLECKGRFDFFDRNLFTFVKVDDKFSIITTENMKHLDYKRLPMMLKPFTPGTHITVMTNYEQKRVSRAKLWKVYNKWKDVEVLFKIKGVELYPHQVKDGEEKMICTFEISSDTIDHIRLDLGLDVKTKYYNMHMSLCERSL